MYVAGIGQTIAASYLPAATSTPAGPALPACVSRLVHDQAESECMAQQQVKGIGVVGYEQYGSPCRLVSLPICPPVTATMSAPVSVQSAVQTKSAPIAVQSVVQTPKPALNLRFVPALRAGPAPLPLPTPIPAAALPQPAPQSKTLIVGGILALVAVGGYLIYRSSKKKAAPSAS